MDASRLLRSPKNFSKIEPPKFEVKVTYHNKLCTRFICVGYNLLWNAHPSVQRGKSHK